jgi:serpin B
MFSLDLIRKLSTKGENAFASPTSLFILLCLLEVGSDNNTKKQLRSVLHIDDSVDVEKEIMGLLHLEPGTNILRIVNDIWVPEETNLTTIFDDIAKEVFGCKTREIKTKTVSERQESVYRINQYIEEVTEGKIRGLLNVIMPDDLLILTNAVYFLGEWSTAFPKENTKKGDFFKNDGSKVSCDMMSHSYKGENLLYFEDERIQVVSIPYKGLDKSMIIFLPKIGKMSTQELLDGADFSILLDSVFGSMTKKVRVVMPKFNMKKEYKNLKDTLIDMGIVDAFNCDASFPLVVEHDPIYITKIIQKTFIEVDEVKTEAAAATAVHFFRSCCFEREEDPILFSADRPFIFSIIDKDTRQMLFVGKMEDPTQG